MLQKTLRKYTYTEVLSLGYSDRSQVRPRVIPEQLPKLGHDLFEPRVREDLLGFNFRGHVMMKILYIEFENRYINVIINRILYI